MAALREVIIGNIRITISAGANPDDRQMTVLGDAQVYDQNVSPTRAYVDDLTSKLDPDDLAFCQDMVDRFIAGIMTTFEITQADIDEGRDILNAQGAAPQAMLMSIPLAPDPPPPEPEVQNVAPAPTLAPMFASVPEGGVAPPPTQVPPEPVSSDTGDGTIIIPS